MSNYDFLLRFQCLQYTLTQNKLIDLGFASVGISDEIDSPYFNNALVNRVINPEELVKIKDTLAFSNRKSTVYFERKPEMEELVKFLESLGYTKAWEDAWMFHDGKITESPEYNSILTVCNESELSTFLKVLNDCYRENDPLNPYGQLGGYLQAVKTSWLRHKDTGRIALYMLMKENTPVAVAVLNNFGGMGYISTIASAPEERGHGYAKIMADYCELQSEKAGNTHHVLVTEMGFYPNKYYEQAGLKTRFTAVGYTLGV